jgi:hypothetical protein
MRAAPRGICYADSPFTIQQRQHEPGWRAPSVLEAISITPSQLFPLPLRNTLCKLHLRRVSRARDDVRSFSRQHHAHYLGTQNSTHTHENSHTVIRHVVPLKFPIAPGGPGIIQRAESLTIQWCVTLFAAAVGFSSMSKHVGRSDLQYNM